MELQKAEICECSHKLYTEQTKNVKLDPINSGMYQKMSKICSYHLKTTGIAANSLENEYTPRFHKHTGQVKANFVTFVVSVEKTLQRLDQT